MKRKILLTILIALAAVCLFAFAGCADDGAPDETSYTIQYNDGSKNCTVTVKNGDLYDIPVPEKRGYNFIGLFNAREGGVQYVDENGLCTMPFSGTSNMILYAQFEAKTYTVVYDYDKADNEPYTCTAAYDEILPMPAAPSYVYGYEFEGWYTNKDMTGTRVSSTSAMDYKKGILSYDNFALDNLTGGQLVLYAGFKLNEYEVKFYSADGRELIASKVIGHGTDINDLEKITYNGMTVLEWGRTVKGTPVTGEITDEMTLYAVTCGINIIFEANGGSVESPGLSTVGKTITLPVPSKQYSRFICWTENGEPVDNNYLVPDRPVTLVARWERTHYQLNYVSDGVSVSSQMVEKGATVTLRSITRDYYRFVGWTLEGNTVESGFEMPEEDITLTAQWERTHYRVNYDTDGGGVLAPVMLEKGASVALPAITREYYKFVCWLYDGEAVNSNFIMPEEDITLTAHWEKTHYKLTYITDDNNNSGTVMVERGASLPELPVPTKTYYVCVGWDYKGILIDGNFEMPEKDIEIYVHWEQEFKDYTYISTAQEFVNIKNDVKGKYMLISDLDLSAVEREPLLRFEGEIKGNNHIIDLGNRINTVNLQSSTTIYYGWFTSLTTGKLSDFTVKNLVCKSLQGYNAGTYFAFIGGLCGYNTGTISNVKIENSISGNASKSGAQIVCERNLSRCGGLCGENGGTITGCSVSALIFSEGDTGGITGVTAALVSNCKFTGKIGIYLEPGNGNTYLRSWGGIVGYGYNVNSTAKITGCSVTSCTFEYYGENSAYHNSRHYYCTLNFSVGIICGVADSTSILSGNSYSNCSKSLVLKGGNNHYGSHEKSRLFSKLDGQLGG